MQPIALDLGLIKSIIDGWGDYKVQREFHKMIENLEKFHSVPVDQVDGNSAWQVGYNELLSNIKDQNLNRMFKDLLYPRNSNIKYFHTRLTDNSNLLKTLADSTPDKIGLEVRSHTEEPIKYYDISSFNTIEYNSACRLYRIPKTINIKPGKVFPDLRLFAPYLRDARKIEFCDLFLFKAPKFRDDAEFIYSILRLCNKPEEVHILCEPNPMNLLQKKVEVDIKREFGNKVFQGFKIYNPPAKDVNHDRFIIIDTDKISIRFSCSFNNLRINVRNSFKAKDAFMIEFSKGRKYYD